MARNRFRGWRYSIASWCFCWHRSIAVKKRAEIILKGCLEDRNYSPQLLQAYAGTADRSSPAPVDRESRIPDPVWIFLCFSCQYGRLAYCHLGTAQLYIAAFVSYLAPALRLFYLITVSTLSQTENSLASDHFLRHHWKANSVLLAILVTSTLRLYEFPANYCIFSPLFLLNCLSLQTEMLLKNAEKKVFGATRTEEGSWRNCGTFYGHGN